MAADQDEMARDAFAYFDSNCDSKLTYKELDKACKALERVFSDEDLKSAITEINKSENDLFTIEDMYNVLGFLKSDLKSLVDSIKQAFRIFDKNGSGVINASDLRHALTTVGNKLSDAEASEMIAEADVNNDGRILYETFVDSIMNQHKL